ncbi:Hypothetical predicted protein [Pelobates cultripes]|uniref:Uncharacterized protein n=1 Tax=Pelobates cultripes TaxID=61616 RepID=A0AAD1SZU8_PELCU|nr:Hypothetical predicted protein [Pelobates cultripes]
MSSTSRNPLPCSAESSDGEQSISSPPRKRRQKSDPCAGCDGKALEGKPLCLNCFQKVATPAAVTPTQSPDILTWIRQEVAQGISEAMKASNRSVKRPRQRLVSSEYLDSAEEFQVLGQIYSSENEEEVLSEYLDAKTVDKLILKVRKTLELPEDLPKPEVSDKHFADLRKQKPSFPLHRAIKEVVTAE